MSEVKRILVAQEDDRWTVTCTHCDRAWAWDLMSDAHRSARAHVGTLPEGRIAEILVQKSGGPPESDWAHGRDPFPPER